MKKKNDEITDDFIYILKHFSQGSTSYRSKLLRDKLVTELSYIINKGMTRNKKINEDIIRNYIDNINKLNLNGVINEKTGLRPLENNIFILFKNYLSSRKVDGTTSYDIKIILKTILKIILLMKVENLDGNNSNS